jgi:EAL domain-containing protein (putative c-di-GMP-specific phosphodiesterase class I)
VPAPSPLVGPPSLEELIDALTCGDIRASFRPVVHLGTGAPVGWEAVGRWDVQARGVLREASFLPVADRGEVRHLVEAAVIDHALRALALFDAEHASRPTMSVGVSVGSLLTGDVSGLLDELLDVHGVAASRVRVTLADVACGDHAFTKLRMLPLDRVQLGACCVAGIDGVREQAIVRAVIALA